MSLPSPVRRASLLAAGALALASLAVTAPAANAAPVFTDAETVLDAFASGYTQNQGGAEDCAVTSTGGAEPDVQVVENGPAATASTSASATFVDNNTPTDTASGTTSSTATGKVTSVGGVLATLDFTGQSATTFSQPNATACYRSISSGIDMDFRFTVAQSGVLTLDMTNTGTSYGEVYLFQYPSVTDTNPYFENYGRGVKFDSSSRVFLPAGTYQGYFETQSSRQTAGAASGTTTVHGQFAVAGSQTEAVSGKGQKYSTLPSARSCATDSIDALITKKKAKANQIKQVTFYVNDQKVKKVKKIKKNAVVKLPVADDVAADVLAEVQLKPAKKGRPAKTVEVTASYEACS